MFSYFFVNSRLTIKFFNCLYNLKRNVFFFDGVKFLCIQKFVVTKSYNFWSVNSGFNRFILKLFYLLFI